MASPSAGRRGRTDGRGDRYDVRTPTLVLRARVRTASRWRRDRDALQTSTPSLRLWCGFCWSPPGGRRDGGQPKRSAKRTTTFNPAKTERAGFEPAMEFDPHTRLAGECLQPLGHLSKDSGKASLGIGGRDGSRYAAQPSL